ncbi:MAG: dTDP-4-dehydrorhamnose 3,5-epimerase [Crenarchaeota archaeon]|nr:dTDP-4-dehydrorhamnose 3,5-epimerase [Thermoproteota archaeon]
MSVRELWLPGVKLADIARFVDERGAFHEVMRIDWRELLGEDKFVQANLSVTYPGVVRAWHRHLRGQVDYFFVVRGSAKVCVYDEESRHLVEVVLAESRPQILRVPGHYWHGFKAIGTEPVYLLYFVTKLYDYSNPDEERRPWNDESIVPLKINGRSDDPRCGKAWDWFYPPHR